MRVTGGSAITTPISAGERPMPSRYTLKNGANAPSQAK
jgi:hypothetical protein